MRKSLFNKLMQAFARDERGAFAVIFALMSLVLVASAGAVVDYSFMQQVRKRAQISIDSAALSLQRQLATKSVATIKSDALQIMVDGINDDDVTIVFDTPQVGSENNKIFLRARLTVPTYFLSMISIGDIDFNVSAEATRDALKLEVALVLDNSISMAGSPMSNLKSAATNAVNILFGSDAVSSNMYMSVVPFGFTVNVGASNRSASWMDGGGDSAISADNFDDDDNENNAPTVPRDRFALFDQMPGTDWWGCVEARAAPYDTLDTLPNSDETRYIPAFAPDYPDISGGTNNYLDDDPASCQSSSTSGLNCGCTRKLYSYPNKTCETWNSDWSVNYHTSCSCPYGTEHDYGSPYKIGYSWYQGSYCSTTSTTTTSASGLSNRELQERVCKYDGNAPSSNTTAKGPNQYCATPALTPLTNVKASITNAISAMDATGGTNIHMGAAWGWRVLSPTLPFSEGDDYDEATAKIMILMTDGVNRYFTDGSINGGSYLTAYGYPYNERLGTMSSSAGQLENLIDDRTTTTCTNAKAAGITIYTIGLGSPSSVNQSMLIACASDSSKAYFPSTPGELNTVFATIADRLSPLRLAQ